MQVFNATIIQLKITFSFLLSKFRCVFVYVLLFLSFRTLHYVLLT